MASLVRLAARTLRSAVRQTAGLTGTAQRTLPPPSSTTAPLPLTPLGTAPSSSQHRMSTCCRPLHPSLTSAPLPRPSLLSPSSPPTASSPSPFSLLFQHPRLSPSLGGVPGLGVRSYHVRVALKKRCSSCYFVRRKGRLFVECKSKPRHKQMQVMSNRKTWREDYSKGFIQRAVHWKYHRDFGYYKQGDNQFARHDWLKGKIGVTV